MGKADSKRIRIGLVNCACPVGETENNLLRTMYWARKAAAGEVRILCFPEMNITGYSNRNNITAYAQPIPGPVTEKLRHIADTTGVTLLAGMVEKTQTGQYSISHVVVSPGSETIGIYRKVHMSPPEKGLFSPGDTVPLFSAEGFSFGIQLCYDAHFPEISTRMALDGADIIFVPHASPRGPTPDKFNSWMRHLPARAFDNGIFIAACNQVGENGQGLTFYGVSLVIDASGWIVNKDTSGRERMLTAEISKEKLDRVRRHKMRYFLPNRRQDLYFPRN